MQVDTRINTPVAVNFRLVDSNNAPVNAVTWASGDVTVMKPGSSTWVNAAGANPVLTTNALSLGDWQYTPTAGEVDTRGTVIIRLYKSGVFVVTRVSIKVESALLGDSVVASSVVGNVGGNVTGSVGSVVGNVGGNIVGTVASVVGNVGGNVVGSVASVVGAVGSVAGNVVGSVGSVLGNVAGTVASVVGAVGSVTGNVGGNLVGNVNGNVVGSVGSVAGNVTGSVGSVAGAVGSVTGNVGGNVVGSVASVAGSVGGNVTGTVGSVVAAVSVGSMATDSLSAAAVSAGAASKIGATVPAAPSAAAIDAQLSGTHGSGSWLSGSGGDTAATIASAVWDKARTSHTTAGTFGAALQQIVPTATDVVTALLAAVVETAGSESYTVTNLLQRLHAYIAGNGAVPGATDGTYIFRALNGTTVRIQATIASAVRTITGRG